MSESNFDFDLDLEIPPGAEIPENEQEICDMPA